MDEDYWNTSSVTKKVSQQGIFDTDGSNTIDVSIFKEIIFHFVF